MAHRKIEKTGAWQDDLKFIERFRNLRRTKIKVQLLMITTYLEYWLFLHYKRCVPSISSPEDKVRMLKRVQEFVPLYRKGNFEATAQIAEHFPQAVESGKYTLVQLLDDGMPCIQDTDEKNAWLFSGIIHLPLSMRLFNICSHC